MLRKNNSMLQFMDDPFFSDHQDRLRKFDEFFAQDPRPKLPDPFASKKRVNGAHAVEDKSKNEDLDLMPRAFGRDFMTGFAVDMFGEFDRAFKKMHQQMGKVGDDPTGYSFSHAAVHSYSKDEDGKPKYFEASTSSRNAPGGIRETRKTVRDSERELDKMAVGHHIGQRGHIVERSRHRRTGHQDEKQDLIGIETDQVDSFAREWSEKTKDLHPLGGEWNAPIRSHRHVGEREDRHRSKLAIEGKKDKRKH